MIDVGKLLATICATLIMAQPTGSTELQGTHEQKSFTIGKSTSLVGAELASSTKSGATVRYRIASEQFDRSDANELTQLYVIQTKTSGGWVPFCKPDNRGRRTAIPLKGHWDGAGDYKRSDNLTFACTAGVLAKCILWGYAPWKPSQQRWSMRELHQTCTRMARADYCGNGKSHTRNGTRINIYDNIGIRDRDTVADLTYEAAWGPDGATEIVHTRWGESLADIVAECPEKNWIVKTNPRRIIRSDARPVIMNDSRPQRPPSPAAQAFEFF